MRRDIIRIKRGTQAAVDGTTLLVGEFAFTLDTNRLYIGTESGNLDIRDAIDEATESEHGLMSAQDKVNIGILMEILGPEAGDLDDIVNTLREILDIFESFPEGTSILDMKEKLDDIEAEAEVNIIEGVIVDGVTLALDGNRKVTIPTVNDTDQDGVMTHEDKARIDITYPDNAVLVAASDTLNKDQYNHVCDGTDDQVEIQAAIDEAETNGVSVVLLPGIYSISDTINLKTNSHIYGYGATIDSNEGDYRILYASGVSEARLSNVTVEGLKIIDGARGIQASYVDGVVIKNCYFENISFTPVMGYHTNDITIKDNSIQNCATGFVIVAGNRIKIANNTIIKSDECYVVASDDVLISGNLIDIGELTAGELAESSYGIGLSVASSNDVIITKNIIKGCRQVGIYVYQGTALMGLPPASVSNIVITGNYVVIPEASYRIDTDQMSGITFGGKDGYYTDYALVSNNKVVKADDTYTQIGAESTWDAPIYANSHSRYAKIILNDIDAPLVSNGTDNIVLDIDVLDTIEEDADVNIIEGIIIDGVTLAIDGSKKTTIPTVNDTDQDGVMTYEDKSKLDTVEESADVNVIEGIIVDGVTLALDGSKKATIPLANDTDQDGLITHEDKAKLDTVEEEAEVNIIEGIIVDGIELTPDVNRKIEIPLDVIDGGVF